VRPLKDVWWSSKRCHHYKDLIVSGLFTTLAICGILILGHVPASAQTAPTDAEVAAYRGLHAAAARGAVEDIERLVNAGADLNARDGNGRTPLHVAAFQGDGRTVQALLGAGADPSLLDKQRYDAVTIVAVRDDVSTLKALLVAGASAKLITSVYDGTALIAASHLGRDGIVRELIRAGAPLDHVNNLGWTALMEAVILGDGGRRHVETVRALVDAGADVSIADRQGVTPLQHARNRGYRDIVAVLELASRR
jgi:ankyrin repeat protein